MFSPDDLPDDPTSLKRWLVQELPDIFNAAVDRRIEERLPDLIAAEVARQLAELEKAIYPKRIILIRHAETLANVDRSLYDSMADYFIRVDAAGVRQINASGHALADYLSNIPDIGKVAWRVSPYHRADYTAQGLKAVLDEDGIDTPDIRLDWMMVEHYHGSENFRRLREALGKKEGHKYLSDIPHLNHLPQEESELQVMMRTIATREAIFRRAREDHADTIIMVGHSEWMKCFIQSYADEHAKNFNLKEMANCEILVIERKHAPDGDVKKSIRPLFMPPQELCDPQPGDAAENARIKHDMERCYRRYIKEGLIPRNRLERQRFARFHPKKLYTALTARVAATGTSRRLRAILRKSTVPSQSDHTPNT